jgi:2'-5' RNA ligase
MAKNEHLVVIPLEELKKSEQFVEWPLHITVVPWFAVEEERGQELDDLLSEIATRHHPIELIVGRLAMFGAHNDTPVNLIDPSQALTDLHLDVLNSLEANHFPIHQKEWLGDKYQAHIAHQEDKFYTEGQHIQIANFALIKQLRQKVTGTMVKELEKDYLLNER